MQGAKSQGRSSPRRWPHGNASQKPLLPPAPHQRKPAHGEPRGGGGGRLGDNRDAVEVAVVRGAAAGGEVPERDPRDRVVAARADQRPRHHLRLPGLEAGDVQAVRVRAGEREVAADAFAREPDRGRRARAAGDDRVVAVAADEPQLELAGGVVRRVGEQPYSENAGRIDVAVVERDETVWPTVRAPLKGRTA